MCGVGNCNRFPGQALIRRGYALAAFLAGFASAPASATIDNTVTVRGTAPGGPVDGVVAVASESVDVVDAAPGLTIVKTAVLNDEANPDGFAEVGETTTYTYEVTNSGNVTLSNVAVQDNHEGSLLVPSPAGETIVVEGPNQPSDIGTPDDGFIDRLEVGAIARFTITLPVTQQEVDDQ